jgi:hypothetical protein
MIVSYHTLTSKPTAGRPYRRRGGRSRLRRRTGFFGPARGASSLPLPWSTLVARSSRKPPLRPRASPRSRVLACDPRGARTPPSTSTASPPGSVGIGRRARPAELRKRAALQRLEYERTCRSVMGSSSGPPGDERDDDERYDDDPWRSHLRGHQMPAAVDEKHKHCERGHPQQQPQARYDLFHHCPASLRTMTTPSKIAASAIAIRSLLVPSSRPTSR